MSARVFKLVSSTCNSNVAAFKKFINDKSSKGQTGSTRLARPKVNFTCYSVATKRSYVAAKIAYSY